MGRGIPFPERPRFFWLSCDTDSLCTYWRSLLRLLGKRISDFLVAVSFLVSLRFFRFLGKRIPNFLLGASLLVFVGTEKSRKIENRAEQLFFARPPTSVAAPAKEPPRASFARRRPNVRTRRNEVGAVIARGCQVRNEESSAVKLAYLRRSALFGATPTRPRRDQLPQRV